MADDNDTWIPSEGGVKKYLADRLKFVISDLHKHPLMLRGPTKLFSEPNRRSMPVLTAKIMKRMFIAP